jgi:hypothetical protein
VTRTAEVDLILATRLDLLKQALDEAYAVRDNMRMQRERLASVADCLSPKGQLSSSEEDISLAVHDAVSRLSLFLTGATNTKLEDLDDDEDGDEDGAEDGDEDDDGSTRGAQNKERRHVLDAFRRLSAATLSLKQLKLDRGLAHASFAEVSRWSVAGLADEELTAATADFEELLDEIRDAPNPWQRYELELRGRGQLLFTRYLELLGGMAVQSLRLQVDEVGDEAALLKLLLNPLGQQADEAPPLRSLHLPMGTRHPPLGYSRWGLWALPLIGRTVGEHLLERGKLRVAPDSRSAALYADVYALYVLGPSYVHAAVFLELDPDDDDAHEVSDAYRAEVLLHLLPRLDESAAAELSLIRDRIAKPWQAARSAFGGAEVELAEADVAGLEAFLAGLRQDHAGLAWTAQWLSDAEDNGRRLIAGGDELKGLKLHVRDILTAVWLARQETPDASKVLHDNAKIVPRVRAGGNRPFDAARSRQLKGV